MSVEIRLNNDETIDEVVAKDATVHLEQLADDLWCLIINDTTLTLGSLTRVVATEVERGGAEVTP